MKTVSVLALIAMIIFFRAFFFDIKRLPSGAMSPSVLAGDFIITYRWPYGNYGAWGINIGGPNELSEQEKPDYGDVITFKYPINPTVEYIKRIVGLPGDKISYKNKTLLVNGKEAKKTYEGDYNYFQLQVSPVKAKTYKENNGKNSYRIQLLEMDDPTGPGGFKEVTIPDGQYFVLGDNRDRSNDSRFFGFLPEDHITGKVLYVFFSYDLVKKKVRWDRLGTAVN